MHVASPVHGVCQETSGAGDPQVFGILRGRRGYSFNQALLYAAGGGLDDAFTRNMSVEVEGLYVDLRNGTQSANATFDTVSHVPTVRETKRGLDFEVAGADIDDRFRSGPKGSLAAP